MSCWLHILVGSLIATMIQIIGENWILIYYKTVRVSILSWRSLQILPFLFLNKWKLWDCWYDFMKPNQVFRYFWSWVVRFLRSREYYDRNFWNFKLMLFSKKKKIMYIFFSPRRKRRCQMSGERVPYYHSIRTSVIIKIVQSTVE